MKGTVTRGGKPIEVGAISLTPAKGNKGLAGNGSIVKGAYEFTSENGPTSGPYEVYIQEFLPKEELMKRKAPQGTPPDQWKFEYDVPDTARPTKDFQVE